MYIHYDLKGNIDNIDTTRINEKGFEVGVERISFNKDGSIFTQYKGV